MLLVTSLLVWPNFIGLFIRNVSVITPRLLFIIVPMVTDRMSTMSIITARKRSCGKVMFLQVSVILFTGWVPGPRGCLVRGVVPGPGGGCLVLGLVPGPRGVPGSRGGAWSGGCLVEIPPGRLLLRAVRILLECILVHIVIIAKKQNISSK